MKRRYVLAAMRHETNTFSPVATEMRHFTRGSSDARLLVGERAVEALAGTNSPFAGFYDLIRDDADVVVPCAANAWPQGKVTDAAFEELAGRIVDAVRKGCDGVFLDLHGAMVVDSHDDAEGELLTRVRQVAPELPIAVALDFHANLSSALLDNVTTVAGYRTYPHVDTYETGQRAGRALLEAMSGKSAPVVSWGVLPMLTHMLEQTPSRQPMKDIMDRAIAAEASGEVMLGSVFGGFPLADIPHVGLAAVIVGDGSREASDALRDELLQLAWERRADFVFDVEPMAGSIARARQLEGRPIVLVDHGDNTGAGGLSDVMAVLEEAMSQGLEDMCAGPFCDPEVVAQMIQAGKGATIEVALGGKHDMPAIGLGGRPLRVKGRVTAVTDGTFTVTGPMFTGVTMSLGPSAVLDTGTVQIVVSSLPFEPMDVGCFTHAGIDPARKKFVLIKSRQHFRAGFEPIAVEVVLVAGPGVCSSDYAQFPFERLPCPIYPIDPDTPRTVRGN